MDDKDLEKNENNEESQEQSLLESLLNGAPGWSELIKSTGSYFDFFTKGLPKYENVKGVLITAEEAAKKSGVIPSKAIEKINAQDALAFRDGFKFLGVLTSGASLLNGLENIEEVLKSESASTANKILESFSQGLYVTEGIIKTVDDVKTLLGSGGSKLLEKLGPIAKIGGGSLSFTNAIVQLNEHQNDEREAAKAWSDLISGALDVAGGALELGVATAPLAIPLGILSSAFSIAGGFFKKGNWTMGFFTLIVGFVVTGVISVFMKTVLKAAFKALMQLIRTAFQSLLAPLLINPLSAVAAFALGILIGELLCATLPFAQGGFPVSNQAFIAREAGPELVGTLNGRSAVVNNNQIVAAVSRGVYSAFLSAYNNQESTDWDHVEVFIDGRQVETMVQV